MVGASSLPEFGDFDDKIVYDKCYRAAVHGDTSNFVIEFDSTKANAAHDLGTASMGQLLQLEVNGFAFYMNTIGEDARYVPCYSRSEG